MAVKLAPLPYGMGDLQPWISKETLEYHWGKHHKGYVDKLNAQIQGSSLDKANLEEIVLNSQNGLFNLSAQSFNHDFYWKSLSPKPLALNQDFKKQIEKNFGSLEELKNQFNKEALSHFGSGWAWLIRDKNQDLKIISTHDADTPLRHGQTPLLTCDVWEHAYYIDYRNNRAQYLESFWNIANWEFASQNYFS